MILFSDSRVLLGLDFSAGPLDVNNGKTSDIDKIFTNV